MISPCLTQQKTSGQNASVRVVKVLDDPYAGLKSHDYIKARDLNSIVKRVQTSAQAVAAASGKGADK